MKTYHEISKKCSKNPSITQDGWLKVTNQRLKSSNCPVLNQFELAIADIQKFFEAIST